MATAALIYDFDKTLCPRDMQEYSFIPEIGMGADAFWAECREFQKKHSTDSIMAYMYKMREKANFTQDTLRNMGREIEFFPGVDSWFERVNAFGQELGLEVEHYIVSSGLQEIVEGSAIAHEFKKIYASGFVYDESGAPVWPAASITYTAKTQYLFRINKGILDVTEDTPLNEYTPEEKRPIPFPNMVYIGDGLTDVPCMKLVKMNGGVSVAVYAKDPGTAYDMLFNGRVDFVIPADYSAGGQMEKTVFDALQKIVGQSKLRSHHHAHLKQAEQHLNNKNKS